MRKLVLLIAALVAVGVMAPAASAAKKPNPLFTMGKTPNPLYVEAKRPNPLYVVGKPSRFRTNPLVYVRADRA